jgi:integrase
MPIGPGAQLADIAADIREARDGYQGTSAFGARWNRATAGTEWEGIERRAMRSTIASHVAEQLGVEVAQRLLDHKKLATTETAYVAKRGVGPDASAVSSGLFASEVVAENAE